MKYKDLMEFNRPTSKKDAGVILKNAGYKRIGFGGFSDVYHKDDQAYVLKLFSSSDKGYIDFIKLAKSHTNPHFPKFFSNVIKVTDMYYAVKVEILKQYNADYDTTYDLPISTIISNYLGFINHTFADSNSYFAKSFKQADDILNTIPSLKQACDLIAQYLLPKYNEDIGEGNIMLRDNEIVITDPICAFENNK